MGGLFQWLEFWSPKPTMGVRLPQPPQDYGNIYRIFHRFVSRLFFGQLVFRSRNRSEGDNSVNTDPGRLAIASSPLAGVFGIIDYFVHFYKKEIPTSGNDVYLYGGVPGRNDGTGNSELRRLASNII